MIALTGYAGGANEDTAYWYISAFVTRGHDMTVTVYGTSSNTNSTNVFIWEENTVSWYVELSNSAARGIPQFNGDGYIYQYIALG